MTYPSGARAAHPRGFPPVSFERMHDSNETPAASRRQPAALLLAVLTGVSAAACAAPTPPAPAPPRLAVFADRIELPAVVDRGNFERSLLGLGMPRYHLLVWGEGKAAPAALLRSRASDREVLAALERLGLRPGNALGMATWEHRHDDADRAPEKRIEGPPVEVLLRLPGESRLIPLGEVLRDASGQAFDLRFGGHQANIEQWHSGCVICLYSCPGSKIGNRAHTVREYVEQPDRFAVIEGVLPPDGSEVTVVIRPARRPASPQR
jgi:hypothetical protein